MKVMISWIKRNKLASVLLLVVAYFIYKQYFGGVRPLYQSTAPGLGGIGNESFALKSAPLADLGTLSREAAPTNETNRLVVQESNLSLVVKNVRETVDKLIAYAQEKKGYMVSSSLSQPEEAPYANLVLRIPAKDLKSALEYCRSLALKVSSENLYGYDVTDEYVDIDARLVTLNKTKAKFEEILAGATRVQDLLDVQRELINLQSQIDALKGQQLYLEKTAEMAKVTIYLSTDEFALPYAPAQPFRPAVIFKQAVRSLVGTLRSVFKAIIWLGVYGVLIIPVVLIIWIISKRFKNSSRPK